MYELPEDETKEDKTQNERNWQSKIDEIVEQFLKILNEGRM